MGQGDGVSNEKYNIDYYSSSESDSDFDPEHKYETLI